MKNSLFISLSLLLIVVALVGLNAASYAPTVKEPDTEEHANRSTYNGGATGMRAFFDFLRETGKPVMRWQEKTRNLLDENRSQLPTTFVIIGNPRREFEENDNKSLLDWVAAGNRLVVINREVDAKLFPQAGEWQVSVAEDVLSMPRGDSSNVSELTNNVTAARPIQFGVLTVGVNSVMPSKFASSISFVNNSKSPKKLKKSASELTPNAVRSSNQNSNLRDNDEAAEDEETSQTLPSKPTQAPPKIAPDVHHILSPAPITYLTSNNKNILVDYSYGAGRIILLSDPYIVSNGGIELADNLKLASNLVGSEGLIAFDEYHQGYGASGNLLLNFFEDTPIPAIAAQLALLLALAIYTKGSRFARALPQPNPDRRSKLEYVRAMAELQRRTQAYDLAIENIYGQVRRNLARSLGVDNLSTPPNILAEKVAERSRLNKAVLAKLFRACEDVIQGKIISGKQALELIAKLRKIEQTLGLRQTIQKPKL